MDREVHIRHLRNQSGWLALRDGIEGLCGVREQTLAGRYIGADFICMQPGTVFPLHTHPGDHLLYVIEGTGFVHIDNRDITISAGDLIHIPAERAHRVAATPHVPLLFLAMGYPHKAIDAVDRMSIIQTKELSS